MRHAFRDVKFVHTFPTLRPGGNLYNEADHVRPKTPIRVGLRYWWRLKINRELPSEAKVRDILHSLQTKGLVDLGANNRWSLRRK
jgi:hypothetical protein